MSCGKAVTDETDEEVREESAPDGTYTAIFMPVNSKISSSVFGKVEVRKYGDHFQVDVRLKDAPRGSYRQYLHTGTWCPKMNQDLNGDGYLDGYEARLQAGYIIVPFDGDLSAQNSGGNYVLAGSYTYNKSTSYHLMLSDLHLPDDVVNDAMIKLKERELPLERRVVMIYAVRKNLPSSVVGTEVPIACGILTLSSEYPSPSEDSWETDSGNPDPGPRPRPRPRPRPQPEPRPEPDPSPDPDSDDNTNDSWWDWVRNRWNRWRRGDGGGGNSNALDASSIFSKNSV